MCPPLRRTRTGSAGAQRTDKPRLEKPGSLPSLRQVAKRVLPASVVRLLRSWARRKSRRPAEKSRGARGSGPAEKMLEQLERQVFESGSASDVAALEEAVAKTSGDEAGSCRGALALARWDLASGRPELAMARISELNCRDADTRVSVDLLRVDCLLSLGEGRQALAALAPMIARGTKQHGLLLRMGHARSLFRATPDHGSGPIIEALNRLYYEAGLSMLRREDVRAPVAIGNLASGVDPASGADDPVQVSVVVVHDGRPGWSLKSIADQSWPNLEIVLVVPSEPEDEVREKLRRSPVPLKVIEAAGVRSERLAAGVRHSSGELIVAHSSSSWAHPQRVESQVNAIGQGGDARASIISRLMVHSTLTPLPRSSIPGPSLIGPDPSSLMVMRGGRSDSDVVSDFDGVASNYSDLTGEVNLSRGTVHVLGEVPLNLELSGSPLSRAGSAS